ncbi:sensor domain-containing diguanylate cyclase [Azoarcus sp. DD4]|uniref:putative bifunctional diguanylate cyclase/phosphodiesterase n=1 Tax=Azoarcus sp. DD4 TaxID=2027405 RepID=UPI001129355B|nr:EAL domain-containing protein [Azoarcus sp. DD4]QDF95772.1 sensor domain-containing diguanylate cyclase [Azoarcus sp. DD4]
MRLPFRHSSIRFRLLLASTAVQVVLLTLLLANSVRLMNDAASASLATVANQNANMLHAMATAYGEQGRYDTLQDVLGELLADSAEGLVYVRIGRPDGRLLVSAGASAMTALPPPTADMTRALGSLVDRPVIHIRRPLLLDRNEIGFLQFGVSVSVLAAARQAIIEQGTLIALAEILLTFVLLSGIGYLLTHNLGRLLAGSRAIAEGHLDHRLPEKGDDELARLARNFNIMAATLQQRVGELQRTALQLRTSEERYALALRGANDGLWDWDLPSGNAYFSERFCEIVGRDMGEHAHADDALLSYLHPDELTVYRQVMRAHLRGESAQFMLEHRIRLPDGSVRWVMTRGVAQRDGSGRASRMAGSISDIDLRKRAEQQLLHDALHDGLTGLPNRALFIEHVHQALGHQRRDENARFAVLAINIERFSLINDSFGHAAGDELLRRIADHITASMNAGDVAARVGGDQFALLLNGIGGSTDALRIAESLVELPGLVTPAAGRPLHLRCRIGVVVSDKDRDDAESILRDADNALHKARRGEAEAVAFFHASMHTQALRALQLEADLRTALRTGGLCVHYQPIVSLADRRLASFEALVRWQHPTHGLLPPAEFIPLAETLDLIHDVGMRVLSLVCRDLLDWGIAHPGVALPPVSVNLSARQLIRPGLADELLDLIESHGVPLSCLRFEITESLLARPDGPATPILHQLRDAGATVLIDDFGTGYSALSYLHTIPCDIVKLDGSFVRSITDDGRLRDIVRRSIQLAHDLGMTVIAECIEQDEQATVLKDMNCDYGQGYLFARPLEADSALRLIAPNTTGHPS